MKIRPYQPEDAGRMEDIFLRAVRKIGREFYSAEQVAAWSGPRVSAERLDGLYSDGRVTFIATDREDRAIAFSDHAADGHIDMLYCDPAFARQGVATALLEAVESNARSVGIDRLFTEASEAEKHVFRKAGFLILRRRELNVDGVSIHHWAMAKRLA